MPCYALVMVQRRMALGLQAAVACVSARQRTVWFGGRAGWTHFQPENAPVDAGTSLARARAATTPARAAAAAGGESAAGGRMRAAPGKQGCCP